MEIRTAARSIDVLLANLGVGEREAILIAEEIRADQLLVDDRQARQEARRRGIEAVGTLALLQSAARIGLLDLTKTVESLQKTNFFMSPRLIANVLKNNPTTNK